jgi:2,3-bisphosphoglycerate-independent phosphoglycerate mutase
MQHKIYNKVVLVVLDGFGIASYSRGNAVALAHPEAIDFMIAKYRAIALQAAGPLVGLPWGEMGNSEVGHLNIGAGRIVGQDLPRITKAIQDKTFFKNGAFIKAAQHAKEHHSRVHIMGMVSPGGVHSLDEHLFALLETMRQQGVSEVFIHMFTDGRDTAEKVALDSVNKLRAQIAQIGIGTIASVTGRFYAMDRAKHWDQIKLTYDALVHGKGVTATSAEEAILNQYHQSVYDEMIPPTVITTADGQPVATIGDNDTVIYFNFRSDRALQLTEAFVKPDMTGIEPAYAPPANLCFVTMTEYFFGLPVEVAFPAVNLDNNLAEVVSKHGLKQFHTAETEKFAHVTSFFNGGRSDPYPGEERVIVKSPSDNKKNYSDHPEMSGGQVTDLIVDKVLDSNVNLIVANYANCDMVGHTGNLAAAVQAVQAIDQFLARIMQAVLQVDAVLLITADHGNVEKMLNPKTGEIDKDHTTSPVPLIVVANEFAREQQANYNYLWLSSLVPEGVVSDIAPTILALMGLPQPPEMNGLNLFINGAFADKDQ